MMFVSSFWAPFPIESLWHASIHLIFLWIFISAFIALSNRNIKWFYYTVTFIPYMVLIASLFIYYRYGAIRADSKEISDAVGSFSNLAPAIVIPLIPFHIYLYLIKSNRLLTYISFYAAIIVVLISQSRGGYLMLSIIVLGSPFLFSTNYCKKLIYLTKILTILIILIGSIIFFFGYESTIGRVAERFSSSQLIHFFSADSPAKGESDYRRFVQYATGISIIKSHPIMGVGFYGFPTQMEKLLIDKEGSVSHNIFFTVWGEMGILGLLAFVWLVYSALLKTLRERSYCKKLRNRSGFLFYSALGMAISVSLLHAQFRPQLTNPLFYVIFALALSPIRECQYRWFIKSKSSKKTDTNSISYVGIQKSSFE
jgi:O-antigen ligase